MATDVAMDLVKLGSDNPNLRPHIRPILAQLSIVAGPRYRDYVRRFKGPGSPMKKEDWEAKVLGKHKEDSKKEDKKPKITKKWNPKVKEVMEKHNLTDDDADEVKAFKSDKPSSGAKLSPQQLLQRFLQKAKPETRDRMKGVTPGDFMKMLGAIMDEEGAKMASMRADLIKLGMTNPELRPHIRHLLAGCEKLPEGGMRDNCEKKKEEGAKKEATRRTAGYVNRLPLQYRLWADKVLGALGRSGNQEQIRNMVFAFNVYLLSLVAPEQALLVDRLLARFRRAPAEEGYGGFDGADVPEDSWG